MHPDNNCNWDCLDVVGKQRVLEVDEGDGEEVEKGVACMLQVVGVASISPFRMAHPKMVEVCLGCLLHSCKGEDIGKATTKEEPTAD